MAAEQQLPRRKHAPVRIGYGTGGLAYGFIRVNKLTSNGVAWGYANIGNGALASYDIVNDKWKQFGLGCAEAGNNNGLGVARECNSGGGPAAGWYGRVVDGSLIGDEPFTGDERGDVQRFSVGSLLRDINDNNIVVGNHDISCLDLPSPLCFEKLKPAKWLPDGDGQWGDAIQMQQLGSADKSAAMRISNSDPPFAIGFSQGDDGQQHGVLWNVTTGQIQADFGARSVTNAINSSGTMVVGSRITFGFPPPRTDFIWWTDDNWQTFKELDADDVLAIAEGGEHISDITRLTGINDSGQVSAQALLRGEFGQFLDPAITKWRPEVALDATCQASDPGEWAPDNGCGIPIILDTIPLLNTVLQGDVNNDGNINNLDITAFIAALAAADEAAFLLKFPNGSYTAADIDLTNGPTNLDITPFITLLAAPASHPSAVPEPTSVVVLLLTLMAMRRRLRSRI